jgi:hypothetical protein
MASDDILAGIVKRAQATIGDGTDMALVVGGAAGAEAVLEVVRSWFPEQTADISDEVLAIIAGGAMWYFGDRLHERLVPVGFGVVVTGAGGVSSEWVSGIITMLKKKEV